MTEENKEQAPQLSEEVKAAVEKAIEEKNSEETLPVLVNDLKIFFGDDIEVPDKFGNPIIIRQPTVQDFIDHGEGAVYAGVSAFISNPTSCRLQLWRMKIDWNTVSDYKLFVMLLYTTDMKLAKIFFKNIDFTDFQIMEDKNIDPEDKDKNLVVVLKTGHIIDYETYRKLAGTIRHMLGIELKDEYASDKTTKIDIIREEVAKEKKNRDKTSSNMLNMITFALCHPGFKYKKQELRDVCIGEFLASIKRLQVYETTNALIKGMYSGFVDTKKIDKTQMDFLRDI